MKAIPRVGAVWLLLIVLFIGACDAQYTVQHISVYARHGSRTTYFNVFNQSFTLQEGIGNLTANGMRLMYLLGSQLRTNYPSIFPADENSFKPMNYDIMSSGAVRNIESATAFLLGAFPVGTGQLNIIPDQNSTYMNPPFAWVNQFQLGNSSSLPRQYRTLAYRVSTPDIDFNFFPTVYTICPNANQTANGEMITLWNKYNPSMTTLSNQLVAAGFNPGLYNASSWDMNSIDLLHDEMITYYSHTGNLYPGLTQQLYNQISIVSNMNIAILFPTDKLTRLVADGLAREIINGMQNFIDGTSVQTFRYFSGHDTGLFSHLLLYGRTSLNCWVDAFNSGQPPKQPCEGSPDFGSSFIYELSTKGTGNYFVRLMWNGVPFNVCGTQAADQFYCPWSVFKALVQQDLFYNDGDFTSFCGNQLMLNFQKNNEPHTGLRTTLIIMAVVFVVLFLSIGGLFLLNRSLESKLTASGNQYSTVQG
jgi:Histidine phosphatase superfamily (branch 2)